MVAGVTWKSACGMLHVNEYLMVDSHHLSKDNVAVSINCYSTEMAICKV